MYFHMTSFKVILTIKYNTPPPFPKYIKAFFNIYHHFPLPYFKKNSFYYNVTCCFYHTRECLTTYKISAAI